MSHQKIVSIDASKRFLYIENNEMNHSFKYPTNFIKTSKYSLIIFLPKSILIQFKRYANIYFLITAILQSIPQISSLSAFSAIAPVIFVIFLGVIKEGYEDYLRHVSDNELNSSQCTVYRNGKFVKEQWRTLRVGDIVKVEDMDFFPADIVVLSSSNENSMCYIETASLDGEKNLKPKVALKETMVLFNGDSPTVRLEGTIRCDLPNPALYQFEGIMTLFGDQKISLGPKQLLLRGAKLKNTDRIIGVVVYTGIDSKIMKNAEGSKAKASNVEKTVNTCILAILAIEILLCLTCAVAGLIWAIINLDGTYDHIVYLGKSYGNGKQAVLFFFSYFLLLNTMIPISLIISLEFTKIIQAYFVKKDKDLYNAEKERYANVSTSSIIEELGQVEYVFSDKTGTLTCNKMEFKLCVIGERLYGDKDYLKDSNSIRKNKRRPTFTDQKAGVDYTFEDNNLRTDLQNGGEADLNLKLTGVPNYTIKSQKDLIVEFLKCLALCHDCVLEKDKEGNLNYQGPSPDEITLVDFARRNNYFYKAVDKGFKLVEVEGKEQRYEVLQTFEFDSNRKRASVIIKDLDGTIKIYTKGADTIIKKRLSTETTQVFLAAIDPKIEEFSVKGLRTLLVAMRMISEAEYQEIEAKIAKIVDSPNREEKFNEIAEEIEKNLTLIGATAVEDKLQDNVPQTIYDLIKAKIKVWMLTGDKLETAENIGRSCNLIQQAFEVMHIAEKEKEKVETAIRLAKGTFQDCVNQGKPKALLIEGESLTIILENELYKQETVNMLKGCEAVICCRVTPKQKADVVRLIKNSMKKITLAIGDGANDVNMIQEAHIGVGIYGQEGMRAVQASDFAIPEFQGLWKLLFVHGRWSYIRISELILYFFYKNMVFTLPQFFFGCLSVFGAQTVFDSYYITFYNMVFTAIPLVVRACLDQDIYYKKRVVEKEGNTKVFKIVEQPNLKKYYPLLYYVGQQNSLFNVANFFKSVFKGAVHAVLIFVVSLLVLRKASIDSSGRVADMWYFSVTIYTSVVLIVDIKLAMYTRYWTTLSWFALIVLSIGLYTLYIWVANLIYLFEVYQTIQELFNTPQFYLAVALNLGCVLLFETTYVYIKTEYFTEAGDFLRALLKRGQADDIKKLEKVEKSLIRPISNKKISPIRSERHNVIEPFEPKEEQMEIKEPHVEPNEKQKPTTYDLEA